MKVKDCFYVKLKPLTKPERISAMVGNIGLEVAALDTPNGVLKLKNVAAKASIQQKLEMSGLFEHVVFLKNFVLE